MLTTRWNPFAELAAMERDVDRAFSRAFGTRSAAASEPTYLRLPVNIEEADGRYLITAPVAGFKPAEIEVTFAEGTLTISAKHSEEKKDDRHGYVRREVLSGSFYRQIPVGDIDPSSIGAGPSPAGFGGLFCAASAPPPSTSLVLPPPPQADAASKRTLITAVWRSGTARRSEQESVGQPHGGRGSVPSPTPAAVGWKAP